MPDTVTIRFNKDEKELFENVAKMYNTSLSSLIKRLAIEKLEDDLDLESIQEYENLKNKGKLKLKPIEELWENLSDKL